MRLENSCLTQEELILLLNRNWNINVQSSEYIPESTALCRKIISDDGCYFFKEFQDSYSISQVTHEYSVCKFLCENNLPVSQILETIHSKPYVIYKNRIFQLQRYIEGNVQKNNTLSLFQICSSAAELGKIHTLLQNHILSVLFDQVWFEKFDETLYQNYYTETLALIEVADIPHDYKRQITDDITFRFTLTKNMRKISKAFCGVTCTPSHGDYIPSQILFNSTGISGIIDWSNVHTVPAVWELIRFFCLAAKNAYDIDLLMEYIIAYMQYAKLTKLDLKNIPYIYAYYMGRNRFLYREYLKTLRYEDYYDSHRKADLCRFYYENAESIAKRLQQTM